MWYAMPLGFPPIGVLAEILIMSCALRALSACCEVDTRALTRHIRERGAMRVGLSSTETSASALLERVEAQPSMVGAHLADEVSTTQPYVVRPEGEPLFRVVAVDLGIKSMTPVRMAERGLEVHVVPSTISFGDIEASEPGWGVLLQWPRRSGRS